MATPPQTWVRRVWLAAALGPVTAVVMGVAVGASMQAWNWAAFGAGALGWWAALVLRVPFMALFKAVLGDGAPLATAVICLSGPAEEACRAVTVFLVASFAASAVPLLDLLCIGVGWGFIETVFAAVQGLALVKLAGDTSDKALEAKEQLKQMRGGRELTDDEPLWGVLERVSANLLHSSFTLVLDFSLFAAFGTAVVHSATNLTVVRMAQSRGIPTMEVALLVWGCLCFAGSLAAALVALPGAYPIPALYALASAS